MIKANTKGSSSRGTSSSRRRSVWNRSSLGLVTIAFAWIIHETVWQQDSSLRRRADREAKAAKKTAADDTSGLPITIDDLPDLAKVRHVYAHTELDQVTSWDEAVVGREQVVDVLARAGLSIDLDVLKLLPTWEDVTDLYGSEPVILGLDRCAAFRDARVPARRFTGIAGQHNCGTNAMVRYLKQNVEIRGNPKGGFLPQVPWHKHGWEGLRGLYNFSFPADYESVLPIVIVRDPYFWMHSMCESPYLMNWEHSEKHCPNLLASKSSKSGSTRGNPAKTRWGNYSREWDSLAHVWSDFYREYEEATYPRLVIRFEDVLFHTEAVVDQIRQCAGGVWKHPKFVHSPTPVKQNKYFSK
jgi:hypothetical protein